MATHSIVLNSKNYVNDNSTATPTYDVNFPSEINASGQIEYEIAIQSVSVFNNSFNISANQSNNTFSISWLGTTYNGTIPDGYYSVVDLNYFFQSFCIANNLYLVNTTTNTNMYYVEVLTNSILYKLQLNMYLIPTTAQAGTLGLTKPTGAAWSFPTTATTPTLTIGANLNQYFGLSAGTYPATPQTTKYTTYSTQTPIVQTINSYIFTCNFINSPYSIPNNYFFSLPINTPYGSQINFNNSQMSWLTISKGVFKTLRIQILDQNYNYIKWNDNEAVITLLIRQKPKN